MTILEFKKHCITTLSPIYNSDEIKILYQKLLSHTLNKNKIEIALQPNWLINDVQLTILKKGIMRLIKNEPIEYICNECAFFGLTFFVNENTLIPRPETEELVLWIIKSTQAFSHKKILDIGTGSGCISITLKKNIENAEITATDIDLETIEIAKKNALSFGLDINFLFHDITKNKSIKKTFNILVSNPPYILEKEKKVMKNNVLAFEPQTAPPVPSVSWLLSSVVCVCCV